ncbi:hypothetical protein K2173_025839 [Erythroxylum novogranatense]|uniref:HEAT repeat-containing protein 5B n=1 Tax=Erythroxylum novogranatense TaxID=1862640 RepID=A0AAV8SHH4_9ROSI|nr:hypothetical protein K2173_025839 [Erythroxylum novogranatense]
MAKNYVRENVPLSRFGVLVAQLESIVASSSQQSPDPLLCFDLLSDLIAAIEEEPKDSILLWQRKCEDALYSLLVLGARRPVRHLASVAMRKIISKGDTISIYSRASSLQGFLSDGKKSEPLRVAGVAQCLGELYQYFGRRIMSGLLETTNIVAKLMKFQEEFVRQEALFMLQKALEGSGGNAASSAYIEAYRVITRFAVGDKSFVVRIAAARCLRAFAMIGGPNLGVGELDNLASYCVKALEDPISSVRDAFAAALGSLLALGMNPEAQVQPRGNGSSSHAKKLEGGLQRHLVLPFTRASGPWVKDIRTGITLSWVSFLQAIRLKYLVPDIELQNYALLVMEMLGTDPHVDAHALACVLYILRVGVTDQMTEPTQRGFSVFLGKQLESPNVGPSMKIAALRTLSYTLKTLGEVPSELREIFDKTVDVAISHASDLVRTETALTVRVFAEVDPTCVGGLVSYGVTTLNALRDNVSFGKGTNLKVELDSLHGQATVLAALVSISPKLPLGYPARLPRSILEVLKKMLTESSRNPLAATVEKEAGWLLLSSLLSSMPKQELEDQIFDILTLWADLFSGNPEEAIKQNGDLIAKIWVWSAAVDALTAFVKCFISSGTANNGVLLQPVMVYLSSALSCILLLKGKELSNMKPAIDVFSIKTLVAYQSLPDPFTYKGEHAQIIQLCTLPYRDASRYEESSCLRSLLDKRDAWLGPWIPGRDWFEDELRAFQGGKDGLLPSVWEDESSSFPQPETINKVLVNQMLLCFGIMFASQDSGGMLLLLGMIEQCLKSGKRQTWHAAGITNICVGLLAGLKALISLRPQPLGIEILNPMQAIFLSILAEGDICASQRRASSEGLGLLARLGNDMFTARMTRSLISDLAGATDSNYAGSVAFALGCILSSAGGMALSSLVPATVNSVSLLAKSTISSLQIWSLHGLLLIIEAAGFSYVSHVQATLGLALDILLSEDNGLVDLQQGVGRLINAIVAVLGPELAPGSIFFSRCKSVIAEISSWQETATLLESVRFTQQLVLFAPQAVSVHSHVKTLLSTLSSRQPTLRQIAVSTLRHLIEKDLVSIIREQIEDNLFHMLDEETDSEIGNMIHSTITRLLFASCPSCPSHWISICCKMVLATSTRRDADISNGSGNVGLSGTGSDPRLDYGEDDENMVYSSTGAPVQEYALEASCVNPNRDKHLRYRTRVFAAECLSLLPAAVGRDPAHFDLYLARKESANGHTSKDWLVLQIQELISLAYQISTIQFENMRSIGVGLLSTIVDKFGATPDPELPGHLLLEQYQAQLVSAVRTALDASSGPILLEAGLQLATKIMTSGILGGDQVAVKRIFSLISRPLSDFKDIYYPSFAEWVSCKIKIRLLAAHASLKCYTYAFLRRHHGGIPDEYLALLPLFSRSSITLGKYWIRVLKDYSYVCLGLNMKKNLNPFLDGIQSPLVSAKLQPTLEEAWPVILQAVALDAVPVNGEGNSEIIAENTLRNDLISGYNMVELELDDYQFIWGFTLLVLFQQKHPTVCRQIIPLTSGTASCAGDFPSEDTNATVLKLHEITLPVIQFLSTERFFTANFLSVDICQELLQILSYCICTDNSWNSLAISVLSQIVQNCPEDFFDVENFAYLVVELILAYIFNTFQSANITSSASSNLEILISPLFITAKTLLGRFKAKMQKQLKSTVLAFLSIGYKCIREASSELCFSTVDDFVKCANSCLKILVDDSFKHGDDAVHYLSVTIGTCLNTISDLMKDCMKGMSLLESKRTDLRKLLQLKLSFSLEQVVFFAKLAYEIDCFQEGNPIWLAAFNYCSACFQTVLDDRNLQVQAIGLQVLKIVVQRSSNLEDKNYVVLFSGELILQILEIIQSMLKKPVSRQCVAVVGECLRLLALLQSFPKASECQEGFMDLLLKAIIMVFSASKDDSSQEVNDLRTTAITLVSHLAQVPSSASIFKDVLLSMPVEHRQQLQGVIRASVAQDQNAMHIKPVSFQIKLPVPKDSHPLPISLLPGEGSRDKSSHPSTAHSEQDSMKDDQEDDDWDAFQSFPAADSAAETDSKVEIVVEEPSLDETLVLEMKGESSELNTSQPSSSGNDGNDADRQGSAEAESCSDSPRDHDIQTSDDATEQFINHQKLEEEGVPDQEIIMRENDGVLNQVNTRSSCDLQSVEDTAGSIQVNPAEDYKQGVENPGDNVDQQSAHDPKVGREGLIEDNVWEDHMHKKLSQGIENDDLVASDTSPPEKSSDCETEEKENNEAGGEKQAESIDGKEIKDGKQTPRELVNPMT